VRNADANQVTLESITRIVSAAAANIGGEELFMDSPDLMELARGVGAFSWILDDEPPTQDKDKRAERRSFFYACDQFKGRTFVVGEDRINLDSIGDGPSKQWRFKRK
jgi:hypothetical protein